MLTNWFCFVTVGHYSEIAAKNKANWKEFLGQDVEVVEYKDQGSWELNCLQRPQLLLKRGTYSSMTGLIDADVVFKKVPEALLNPKAGYDLIIRKTGDPCLSRYYSAGAVAVYPSPVGLSFLKRWSDACKGNQANYQIGLREQYFLFVAIENAHPRMTLLGPEYCIVPPVDQAYYVIPRECVIYHEPASRQIKKEEVML